MATGSSSSPADRVVVLGRIGAPWGVRGWVRLMSYTEPRETLLEYSDCLLGRDGRWQTARIVSSRLQGKALVGRLEGVEDRDSAIAWRGADIAVARDNMPQPEDGHYYWSDLVGLQVRHRDGRRLGRVDYLLATGEHDVLVVKGEREVLIPFVMNEFVLGVDLANGVIDVDWEWD